jgi:hypothetical protein
MTGFRDAATTLKRVILSLSLLEECSQRFHVTPVMKLFRLLDFVLFYALLLTLCRRLGLMLFRLSGSFSFLIRAAIGLCDGVWFNDEHGWVRDMLWFFLVYKSSLLTSTCPYAEAGWKDHAHTTGKY